MPRLLIVYDGSAAAVAVAGELFPGAEAVIARVESLRAAGAPMAGASSAGQDPAAAGVRESVQAGTDEGVRLANEAGLRATGAPAVKGITTSGGGVVAELASEHGADLIVVGSGASSVLSRSALPVLVVPDAG